PVYEWARLRTFADLGLLALGVLYTLYLARPVLVPMLLALFLRMLFTPATRALRRYGVPYGVGAAAVVVGLSAVLGLGAYSLSGPLTTWVARLPATATQIERKIRDIRAPLAKVRRAVDAVDNLANLGGGSASRMVVSRPGLGAMLVTGTPKLVFDLVIVLALLYFLLASGDVFLNKLVHVLQHEADKRRAVHIARSMERQMVRYLVTKTVINGALGVVVAGTTYAMDMPDPALWGFMVALLNYMPYLGAAVSAVVLGGVALVTFPEPGHALLVSGAFIVLATVEGQLITPAVLGQRLALNPVVIFVAMVTWGWIWGVVGVLLAVPITVSAKIICDHVSSLRHLGEFLGR
ncbi:MAG TPA: AI-2E family transporter, partial [Chromatiales bacterium]|nr:AI-2E family transporter [Chromatiales bacterium]